MRYASKIKIRSDFDGKSAVVKTKGLYCVIYHGPNADKNEHKELLSAKAAIYYASIFNSVRNIDGANPDWAEPISYEDLRERYDDENQDQNEEARIQRRVDQALALKNETQPKPKRLGRLLARAAALIW